MKVTEQVAQFAEPVVQAHGCTLWDVEYVREGGEWFLRLYIDKDGGVTIDDCEALHRAIDAPLDELDPIDCSYTLNVSSPGIDRPLKTPRDYKRNLDKKISVKLYVPRDGKKTYQGTLINYTDDTFTIVTDKGVQLTFDKKDAAKVEPIIEF